MDEWFSYFGINSFIAKLVGPNETDGHADEDTSDGFHFCISPMSQLCAQMLWASKPHLPTKSTTSVFMVRISLFQMV